MKKYRVVYNRSDCIGAAACTAVDSNWVMNTDGKADLKESESKLDNTVQEKIIEEKDFPAMLEAARVCPVVVIHIYDFETGEKII
ncbi:ferredoxin [Candidatus Woesearchaeota archaeon]|nr:ferredoxin [Candidatus Woesearchaeota archaeon]